MTRFAAIEQVPRSTPTNTQKGHKGFVSVPAEERFWAKVERRGDSDCWPWTGSLTKGYGDFWAANRRIKSHRYAYELLVGPIPEGLTLDHLCRNPACVNPAHLEPVTLHENIRRGRNATKMACNYGHDWTDPHNVYVKQDGRRSCAACSRERQRAKWIPRSVRAGAGEGAA